MNLFRKQKQTHRLKDQTYRGGRVWGMDRLVFGIDLGLTCTHCYILKNDK